MINQLLTWHMKTIPEEPTINIIHINNRMVLIINPKPSLTMGPPHQWPWCQHDPGVEGCSPNGMKAPWTLWKVMFHYSYLFMCIIRYVGLVCPKAMTPISVLSQLTAAATLMIPLTDHWIVEFKNIHQTCLFALDPWFPTLASSALSAEIATCWSKDRGRPTLTD